MHRGVQRVLAVVFAVLLVTAAVGPAVAMGESPSTEYELRAADVAASMLASESPAVRHEVARSLVANLSVKKGRQRGARRSAVNRLNATLAAYRDGTRVDSNVFDRDATVVDALGAFAGSGQETDLRTASRLLLDADRATARTAVRDARRALTRAESGTVSAERLSEARESIRTANESLAEARAELTGSEDDLESMLEARREALKTYGAAWRQAQGAIDTLDAGAPPRVRITTRRDPVRNGSTSVNRTVAGTVYDPRPYELENATVTVGNRSFTTELNTTTAPARNATFRTTVTLEQRVSTVDVSVIDPAVSPDDADEDGEVPVTQLFQADTTVATGADLRLVGGPEGSTAELDAEPAALGPVVGDLDGDGDGDLPYVDGDGRLRLIDSNGDRTTLVTGADIPGSVGKAKTRLAVGRWDGSAESVLFVNQNHDTIYRVAPGQSPTVVATPGNGAQAVVGVGDIDGDDAGELVFVGGSQQVRYVDADGSTHKVENGGTGSNNGIGAGALVDLDEDGTASVALVTGSNNIKIVGEPRKQGGEGVVEVIKTGDARKAPPAATDVDGDGAPEIVYTTTDDALAYVDDPGGANDVVGVRDGEDEPVEGSDTTGVVTGGDSTLQPDRRGHDRLRLDGDRLPDTFETGVTETDPLDPNSDSTRTETDESANGVIDGREDFDGDGLTTFDEREIGTNPFAVDSDGDTLSDRYEIFVTTTDPLEADSDGDGTPDGAGDPDDDGLDTSVELEFGSNPTASDTDADGLDDRRERKLGTDPTSNDTDSDGLADPVELRSGIATDPTDPDTDDDGVLDGAETYTSTATNDSLGARVAVTGTGAVAENVTVEASGNVQFDREAREGIIASEFVSFESDSPFEQARITLEYDPSKVDDESDLGLYRFNKTRGTYELVSSNVDTVNDTVSATTTHFSTYTVFEKTDWQTYLRKRAAYVESVLSSGSTGDDSGLPQATADFLDIQSVDPSAHPEVTVFAEAETTAGQNGSLDASAFTVYENGEKRPVQSVSFSDGSSVDIVFVFDDTGSMGGEIDEAQRNVKDFTDGIESSGIDARYALVSFKDRTEVDLQFTDDPTRFKQAIDGLSARGGADFPEDGLDAIYRGTELGFREDAQKVVVHITDAYTHREPRSTHSFDEVERRLREQGVTFYTVSPSFVGTRDLADRTGGIWVDIYDSDFGVFLDDLKSQLTSRYAITYSSCGATDEDARRVDLYATDPNAGTANDTSGYLEPDGADAVSCDTDGDGLPDRLEEEGIPLNDGRTVTTDPESTDTDGDHLADGDEIGSPVVAKVGGELEVVAYRYTSDPSKADTDGDGLEDGTEVNGWDLPVVNRSASPWPDPYRYDSGKELEPGESSTTIRVDSNPKTAHSDGDGASDFYEKTFLHSDPREERTYGITKQHQQRIVGALAFRDATVTARAVGVIGQDQTAAALESRELTDRNDDFDFLYLNEATFDSGNVDGRFFFTALDRTERSDTWLGNGEEFAARNEYGASTEPWDPDTDNDGLTDGQEVKWVTKRGALANVRKGGIPGGPQTGTSPTSRDSDGDGYWDGWIGVHGIGTTNNHLLYMENLQTGNGIEDAHERLDAQAGVHDVERVTRNGNVVETVPHGRASNFDGDRVEEHSNVYLGELHWGTDPSSAGDDPTAQTRLTVEVDWLAGENPYQIRSPTTGQSVIESTERNLRLYGFGVEFRKDDRITDQELDRTLRLRGSSQIDPTTLNAYELAAVENTYHEDLSTLHLLFAREYGPDFPLYIPHDGFIPSNVAGLAGHTGAPTQVAALEESGQVPYGVVMLNDESPGFTRTKAVFIHEMGHAIGAGYADDEFATLGECYSGGDCAAKGVDVQVDQTPEQIRLRGGISTRWSIMFQSGTPRQKERFAFSIEEISTVDFNDIPSKDERPLQDD